MAKNGLEHDLALVVFDHLPSFISVQSLFHSMDLRSLGAFRIVVLVCVFPVIHQKIKMCDHEQPQDALCQLKKLMIDNKVIVATCTGGPIPIIPGSLGRFNRFIQDEVAVAEVVKKNIQRAQAKFREEKASLVKLSEKIGAESFKNVVSRLKLLNLGLVVEGVSSGHEVFKEQIFKVDLQKKVYISVATRERVGPYEEA
ncbi:beta-amylase 1, chloroplastic [Sesbania bispinosa]|nr:beta-amylase 1, chloroplastic [Sesbania bispinosa]